MRFLLHGETVALYVIAISYPAFRISIATAIGAVLMNDEISMACFVEICSSSERNGRSPKYGQTESLFVEFTL